MVGRFEHLDLEVLQELVRKTWPAKYHVTTELLRTHILESPTLDHDASRWLTIQHELVGALAIKRSPAELYPGPDPLQAHVGLLAFRDAGSAKRLFDEVIPILRGKGIQKLIFGQDSRHLFPGCPKEWPELMALLDELGFEVVNDQVDLERDMATYVAPEGVLAPIAPPVSVRPCQPEDLTALRRFFSDEFPGRWEYDVQQKWNLEGPDTVIGLFEEDRCVGFALLQQDGCQMPIGGAVWGVDLGPGWGALGPIGISKSVRGRGLGDALLAAALEILRDRGARRSIIDWTTLIDFYNKHGFQVNRNYQTRVLSLVPSDE